MRLLRGPLGAALAGVATLLSCLLPDDFIKDSAGSTGGTGGVGGAGAAGAELPNLTCAWQLPAHVEVRSTQESSVAYEEVRVIGHEEGANPDARVFALRSEGQESEVEHWLLDGGASTSPYVFGVGYHRLHEVVRLHESAIGLVNQQGTGTSLALSLDVFSDDDPIGSSHNAYPMVSSAELEQGGAVSVRVAPSGDPVSTFPIRAVFGHQRTAGGYANKYALFDGITTSYTLLTDPREMLSAASVDVLRVLFHDGTVYAFVGSDAPAGSRLFAFGDATRGPIAPRVLGGSNSRVLDALDREQSLHVAARVAVGSATDTLLAGRVAWGDAATFLLADLPFSDAAAGEIPGASSDYHWIDDLWVFLGTTKASDTQLRYGIFDDRGVERGSDLLPFTAVIPAGHSRSAVTAIAFARATSSPFDAGGLLHVAFVEKHADVTSKPYYVLYYDQLSCSPVPE